VASAATLVQSSPETRSWLRNLRDELPQLDYAEAKRWASFKTRDRPDRLGTKVGYLNPSKKGIRLFLPFDPDIARRLEQTPSTSRWARRFPSVLQISSQQNSIEASQLILQAQERIDVSTQTKASRRPDHLSADEIQPEIEYIEGAVRHVVVNAYERDRLGREACLEHYGRSCVACGFNFGAKYGGETIGYIHVHHIRPISQIGRRYRLDPIRDLRPVCPNCHAVIHRREPPFSIDEVKQMLKS
jgi:predicted HNH restriction endonuclease